MSKANIDGGRSGIEGVLVEEVQALTASATPAINPALGGVVTLTPGEDETISISGGTNGERLNLVVLTSGTTSRTLTFGTGFKSTGTLATGTTSGKYFVVSFVCVNDLFVETGRTAAQ